MGYLKSLEIEREAQWGAAQEIALRAGVLTRCDVCEDITNDGDGEEIESAYKLGNYLITQNDPLVDLFKGDRRLMTDTIQAVVDDHGESCYCSRHADD
jgi:hypothetical protein